MNEIKKYSLSVFVIVFILVIHNCGIKKSPVSAFDEEININYPATLYPLTSSELDELQEEYDVLNDRKISSKLNEYGLTGRDFAHRINPVIKIPDSETALEYAVSTLIKCKKYTNVKDRNSLLQSGYNISYINKDSTWWGLYFGNQIYHGIEVYDTRITVALFGDGVFNIDGFWYETIYIPPVDKISAVDAVYKLLGYKIIWSDFISESKEFIVTEDKIGDKIRKIIFPLKTESSIELRVVWEIPIMFGDASGWVGWHIYMDTVSGEIVKIIQEFVD